MKSAIIAIALTFAAAGMVAPDSAEARPNRRRVRNHRKAPNRTVRNRAPRRVKRHVTRRAPRRIVRNRTPRVNRRANRRVVRNRTPRRHYRNVTRRRYRRPVRMLPKRQHLHRYWRTNWYRPAQVTLTNFRHRAFTVRVRAGNSPVCVANPVVSRSILVPGASLTVRTHAAYVCYQRVSLRRHRVSPWFRTVVTSWSQSIGL